MSRFRLRDLLPGTAHLAPLLARAGQLDQHHLLPADPAAGVQPALPGHRRTCRGSAASSYLAYLAPGQIVFASFMAVAWSGYGDHRRVSQRLPRQAARRVRSAAGRSSPARWCRCFAQAAAMAGVILLVSLLLGAEPGDRHRRLRADPGALGALRGRLRRRELHPGSADQERAGDERPVAAHVPGRVHVDGLRAGRAHARLDAGGQRLEPGDATRSRRCAR